MKTIKGFLSEFSYSHPLLLAKQSVPLAMDSAFALQMNCGKRAEAQTSHPARSLLAGLLMSAKEDQHKTSEKQDLEQSVFSEY